jgi:glycerol-3-phosphate dehydrogenase
MSKQHITHDIVVIGGGINGVGIAADCAGRGLKVALCEMNDLGSATSSNSSKLIHGGLRYLEYYEFRLVREALTEREVLMKKAPHIIKPLRIRLPHRPHLRPAWMIRAGLFLYDNLSRRTILKGSHGIKFDDTSPLIEGMEKGFEFSDGCVDDARLVILNAIAAEQKGAKIKPRTRCVQAQRKGEVWEVTLINQQTGEKETLYSKALVNAAGPWVSSLFSDVLSTPSPKTVRLVKGSHIIVPRIHDKPQAYMLQNEDNRIVFVIPYENDFSLVGTTDVEYTGDPLNASISKDESDYLISVCNAHFKRKITADDIVKTYSGVRPLLESETDSAQAVSRDYSFELDTPAGKAPLLSVFGGKITTYRKLSEAVANSIAELLPNVGSSWTEHVPLPGGNFSDRESLQLSLQQRYPWLPQSLLERLVRTYGTLSDKILDTAKSLGDLGLHFGGGLYQREVQYLIEQEWAISVEDILWRRTKLGLIFTQDQQDELAKFLDQSLDEVSAQSNGVNCPLPSQGRH